jgi:hypothetical protein
MTCIKITKLVLMLFLGILLTVSSAYPEPAILDNGNPNLTGAAAMYDHRNSGTWTESALGPEGVSGAYLDVSVGVITGGKLLKHSNVRSIKVKHLETGFKFSLQPDICENYLGPGQQAWYLYLRPEDWMFEGNWEFTMLYKGSDRNVHKQIVSVPAGPKVFPMKPSHIQIVKSSSSIDVSWSALGNPDTGQFDYRIQAYEDICPVIVFRGDWCVTCQNKAGTYDPILNKVTFAIPLEWSGHKIRLENRIYEVFPRQGKAVEEFILP